MDTKGRRPSKRKTRISQLVEGEEIREISGSDKDYTRQQKHKRHKMAKLSAVSAGKDTGRNSPLVCKRVKKGEYLFTFSDVAEYEEVTADW